MLFCANLPIVQFGSNLPKKIDWELQVNKLYPPTTRVLFAKLANCTRVVGNEPYELLTSL